MNFDKKGFYLCAASGVKEERGVKESKEKRWLRLVLRAVDRHEQLT